MAKALIYGTDYVNGKPTKYIPFHWEIDDWQSFINAKDYKTLAGCERFLKERGYSEIEYDIQEKHYN